MKSVKLYDDIASQELEKLRQEVETPNLGLKRINVDTSDGECKSV